MPVQLTHSLPRPWLLQVIKNSRNYMSKYHWQKRPHNILINERNEYFIDAEKVLLAQQLYPYNIYLLVSTYLLYIKIKLFLYFGIIAAFNYSGGYYNPVLATGLKWGCRGHSHLEFGIVYWIGASLGAIASIYVYPIIKNSFGIKSKTE